MPPPPPPPPPPPGGLGGPPPPPPPPGGLPSRPPPAAAGRGALLADINKGRSLKKTVTNDRSAPQVGKVSGGPGPSPLGGAPPVPGMAKAPGGLAPPAPGNRLRSNSDQGSRDAAPAAAAAMESAPQLGGLFAGGMPKLRKTGGGVDTGASRDSSYLSDPESSRSSAPKPPLASAPRPPIGAAPAIPGRAVPALPTHPSLANLKRTDAPRPGSTTSLRPVPPPVGKKPPPLPAGRKPSAPVSAPPLPGAPAPPPPSSAAPSLPPAPPPPPPTSAPRPPPSAAAPSLGVQAVIGAAAATAAAGNASPTSAPPPPPPPPPANSRAHSGSISGQRQMLDVSSYTLAPNGSSGGGGSKSPTPTRSNSILTRTNGGSGKIVIEDPRWKWVDEASFPRPREFHSKPRRYRAGRGSSVPLDLSALQ